MKVEATFTLAVIRSDRENGRSFAYPSHRQNLQIPVNEQRLVIMPCEDV